MGGWVGGWVGRRTYLAFASFGAGQEEAFLVEEGVLFQERHGDFHAVERVTVQAEAYGERGWVGGLGR